MALVGQQQESLVTCYVKGVLTTPGAGCTLTAKNERTNTIVSATGTLPGGLGVVSFVWTPTEEGSWVLRFVTTAPAAGVTEVPFTVEPSRVI